MNTHVENTISPLKLYSLLVVFGAIGIGSVFVSIDFFIDMIREILEGSKQIELHKGIYYLFGGGVFFILLVLSYFAIKVLKVSNTIEKIIVVLMVVSIILVFALPQAIHYSVSTYMEDHGYQICKEKSRRWLHVVTIVYTKNMPCSEE